MKLITNKSIIGYLGIRFLDLDDAQAFYNRLSAHDFKSFGNFFLKIDSADTGFLCDFYLSIDDELAQSVKTEIYDYIERDENLITLTFAQFGDY